MSAKLTPVEVIRLGIEQGHSAEVIVASLEAAGWRIVQQPEPPREEEGEIGMFGIWHRKREPGERPLVDPFAPPAISRG